MVHVKEEWFNQGLPVRSRDCMIIQGNCCLWRGTASLMDLAAAPFHQVSQLMADQAKTHGSHFTAAQLKIEKCVGQGVDSWPATVNTDLMCSSPDIGGFRTAHPRSNTGTLRLVDRQIREEVAG